MNVQERLGLQQVCDVPGIIALLPELLCRRPWQQQQQPPPQQITSHRTSGGGQPDLSAPSVVPAVSTIEGVNLAMVCVDGEDEEDGAAGGDADLEKAQAQLAWVISTLASHKLSRCAGSVVS